MPCVSILLAAESPLKLVVLESNSGISLTTSLLNSLLIGGLFKADAGRELSSDAAAQREEIGGDALLTANGDVGVSSSVATRMERILLVVILMKPANKKMVFGSGWRRKGNCGHLSLEETI